jgi:hypothetical protein
LKITWSRLNCPRSLQPIEINVPVELKEDELVTEIPDRRQTEKTV